jgi:hypothetical protein
MSRTIQQQLAALVLPTQAATAEVPAREQSELRRMANRSGFDPTAKPELETVADAFTDKAAQWFKSETQRNLSRAQGLSELLKRTGR